MPMNHNEKETQEERGDDAIRVLQAGTQLIESILSTTLGPRGAMKLLSGPSGITVTNDGATILKNLAVDNPASKLLINASVSQDWEEGDGTTSVALLAALLIEEAHKLDIHPIKIIKGYQIGLKKIKEVMQEIKEKATKEDLINLAKTTLCSKILKCDLDLFSGICVDAIERLEGDLNLVQVIKCTGKLEDSFLSSGFILKKNVEVDLECEGGVKVLIADTQLDADKIKVLGAKINVGSISSLAEIEEAEKEKMKNKIEKICVMDFNVFVNRSLIYDYPLELLKNKGIVAIEQADFVGVERLVKFLGGDILSVFDNLNESNFGICDSVRSIKIGSEKMVKFEKKSKNATSIVLKGSSKEVVDEAERAIHDALCVLNKMDNYIVFGGGATEMACSVALNDFAMKSGGEESESLLALSRALQRIPEILAQNGGFAAAKIKTDVRAEHFKQNKYAGVDMKKGIVGNMKELGVIESFRVKMRIFTAAIEAAQMIIKIDGFVKCKPRERSRH